MVKDGAQGEGKAFFSPAEAMAAYNAGVVSLHARIKVRREGELVSTTVGRVIFNEIVPPEMGYINELLEPVRQYFAENEKARKLFEKVQSFETTR